MHWYNGFYTTLVLRCKPFGRRRCLAARRSVRGHWQLQVAGGRWLPAELSAAWLAGPVAGLAFRGADGARYQALVLAGKQTPADWRRLRVQLNLPRAEWMRTARTGH
jgi:hypothetical protein